MHRIPLSLLQAICAVLAHYSRTDSPNPFPPFSPLVPLPVNATAFSPTIDAVTLCEVINLSNSALIHGESLPAFRPDSCLTFSTHDPKLGHYNNPATLTGGGDIIHDDRGRQHRGA